ncbi:class F sortase [Streptomyces thermodiastaticus]|jgi:hypothetical protein|uniref:class F sortase n=1 Tax=Streptomyces thermodiastaticus TaxID=44061 RepID=UPI001678AC1B|nr:class F sortase [Streptomyces thermodiastaticus]MCE7552720.1 sortase [Streptomyces thermodiastaticus]GHF94568.1 class F sortase [Streptomyces thermodiastaticus]
MTDTAHRATTATAHPGTARPHRAGGRFLAGLAWTVLLLGVWTWGGDLADGVGHGLVEPATGDMAAVGRPAQDRLPPAAPPLPDVPAPRRVEVPGLGVSAPVTALASDAPSRLAPPPDTRAATTVGWYATGVRPGAQGAALLMGRADTGGRPAALHALPSVRPGETVRVVQDGGRTADFTVEAVTTVPAARLAGRLAEGARPGRAELRLIACAGTFDPVHGGCATNVLVSAYLTGTGA